MSRVLSLALFLSFAVGASAQQEPLVKQVKVAIIKGADYLIQQQSGDGSWAALQDDKKESHYYGGPTGLAVLALLNCDGVIDDPGKEKLRKAAIQKGVANLRTIQSPKVYVRSLQTMALADAKTDLGIVKANVQWLLDARVYRDGKFIGWGYDKSAAARESDPSNSQYAMLALWYAQQAGIQIDRKVWEEIRDYYATSQSKDGSWTYYQYYGPNEEKGLASITMTVAGLCGLLIADQERAGGREKWNAGQATHCGQYDEAGHIAKAQQWLGKHFTVDGTKARAFYHLYGIERAGRLSGMRFLGEHDWYREGCEFIVKHQDKDGAWPSRGGWDRWPHINTSFALLFLSKGRTPVLISKLVHSTTWPRREDDTDWNNDRNDLRHLTDYISRSDLFEKKTVGWQTYDIRRAFEARPDRNLAINAADEAAVLADMRQSPILYITGHNSPLPRFQNVENKLIKRFVEAGGFIFAEACCGSPNFDRGFKEWVKNEWDQDLTYVESTHPVWTCYREVQPGQPFKLMELKVGCRTVMLYSPQDLSCQWESNQHDGFARPAFWLGSNIVAFATGRTPPLPRLTPVDVPTEKQLAEPRKRGAFQVRQLRFGNDWYPATKALTNLLDNVEQSLGLEVQPRAQTITFGDASDLRTAKFIYMHGRNDFRVDVNRLEPLRFTLQHGGLLLADACCGDKQFDKAFRKFAQDLFPKEKLTRVPADAKTRDPLFGAGLNDGMELSAKNIQCRTKATGPMQAMEPYLEGIRVNGRWVVLYSPYDLGTALAKSASSDCVGYDADSALRIALAAVRYNTRP